MVGGGRWVVGGGCRGEGGGWLGGGWVVVTMRQAYDRVASLTAYSLGSTHDMPSRLSDAQRHIRILSHLSHRLRQLRGGRVRAHGGRQRGWGS